jgi:hypothetical protein
MPRIVIVLTLAASLFAALWSASSPDAGCIADPNGRCIPAPQTDEGCIADPDGRPKCS